MMDGAASRTTGLQRWLMACLSVLASLMYTVRTAEPAGVALPSPFHMAPLVNSATKDQHPQHGQESHAAPSEHSRVHSATCLFCFTSAFGLEVQDFQVARAGHFVLERACPRIRPPPWKEVRHADPRAPPGKRVSREKAIALLPTSPGSLSL